MKFYKFHFSPIFDLIFLFNNFFLISVFYLIFYLNFYYFLLTNFKYFLIKFFLIFSYFLFKKCSHYILFQHYLLIKKVLLTFFEKKTFSSDSSRVDSGLDSRLRYQGFDPHQFLKNQNNFFFNTQ